METIRILTWNILADCYARFCHKEHKEAMKPLIAFDRRLPHLQSLIAEQQPDIFCLQELDKLSSWAPFLNDSEHNYGFTYMQRPGKNDGCLTAYRRAKVRLVAERKISFNDLVSQETRFSMNKFLRHNVGIVAKFQLVENPSVVFSVINTHLYWDPRFPEVKLFQLMFLLAHRFTDCPSVLVGDTNSTPETVLYQLVTGRNLEEPEMRLDVRRELLSTSPYLYPSLVVRDKFTLERKLNKLARFMRILGIDAELETEEEERKRADCDFEGLTRSFEENRIFLTTSSSLLQRSICKNGFLVSTRDLTKSLTSVVGEFQVPINRAAFLTRCVLCNGRILPLHREHYSEEVLAEWGVVGDPSVPQNRDLYFCERSKKIFWFNGDEDEVVDGEGARRPNPRSSSARAVEQATELFDEMVYRLGDLLNDVTEGTGPYLEYLARAESRRRERENENEKEEKEGENEDGEDDLETLEELSLERNLSSSSLRSIDEEVKSLECPPDSEDHDGSGGRDGRITYNQHCQDTIEALLDTAPLPDFQSAFFETHGHQEPECTNYNDGFSGTLDYIFVERSPLFGAVLACSVVPASPADGEYRFGKHNHVAPPPNPYWPSDHFMVVCDLLLQKNEEEEEGGGEEGGEEEEEAMG